MSRAVRRKYRRKLDLYISQGGKCWLCGERMPPIVMGAPPGKPPADFPTLDHVVPRSKGGEDSFNNYMLAHFECNYARADRGEIRAIERSELR